LPGDRAVGLIASTQIERWREALVELGAADVYEARRRQGALPPGIQPLWKPLALAGPAFTIDGQVADNLALHRAVAEAPAGVVLVAATQRSVEVPIWGDLLSRIAQAKGILGLVTDGAVRDSDSIRALGFPVFCRGTGLFGPSKEHPGQLGEPIVLEGVRIEPSDWVLADGDGVLVIPGGSVAETIAAAQAVAEREREMVRRASLGESTLDQLGLASKT
jgi:4-hydroxy-4-methyl-2-oxoglutarate aldolase